MPRKLGQSPWERLRPRFAHGARSHAVGFFVAEECFLCRVEDHLAPQPPGNRGGVTGDVRASGDVGVGGRHGTRFHAIEEIADVISRRRSAFGGWRRQFTSPRLGVHGRFPRVARLDPAVLAFEPHRARAESEPTGAAKDDFDAIGIPADNDVIVRDLDRFELDGRRVVGLVRPLAKIQRMGSPVVELAAGIDY